MTFTSVLLFENNIYVYTFDQKIKGKIMREKVDVIFPFRFYRLVLSSVCSELL